VKKAKLFLIILIVCVLVIPHFAIVSAAPSMDEAVSISGTINEITINTDFNTGENTVWVVLTTAQSEKQKLHIGEAAARAMGLVVFEGETLVPNKDALGWEVEISSSSIIHDQAEIQHPVGNALAAFFSEIPGVTYDAIMSAHEKGFGFGDIAQALWLTQKMGGDADVMAAILEAKSSGNYEAFTLEDGTVPTNWGQFKKAVLDGDKQGNLGVVMSHKDKNSRNENSNNNNGNHGNGNNGNGSNANGNNGNSDKDKGNHGNNGNKDNNGNKNKP